MKQSDGHVVLMLHSLSLSLSLSFSRSLARSLGWIQFLTKFEPESDREYSFLFDICYGLFTADFKMKTT